MDKKIYFYVGTYAAKDSPGIHLGCLNLATGRLERVRSFAAGANPSYLALHPGGQYLFAVNELPEPEGALNSFCIHAQTGDLIFLNSQPSCGAYPCHISLDRSARYLFTANYGDGSLAVHPILPDGSLANACHVMAAPEGPPASHAHAIYADPGNRFVLSCDLGLDRVFVFKLDAGKGNLLLHREIPLHPQAGPRHLHFSPDEQFTYVINENNSSLTVLAYHAEQGNLNEIQTISTLPEGFTGENYCAGVTVHPSGKFVYASNRGHDSLAIFHVDKPGGRLAPLQHISSYGSFPRSIAISPDGTYLLSANQKSDNIVSFKINKNNGSLLMQSQVSLPEPVCVVFYKLREIQRVPDSPDI